MASSLFSFLFLNPSSLACSPTTLFLFIFSLALVKVSVLHPAPQSPPHSVLFTSSPTLGLHFILTNPVLRVPPPLWPALYSHSPRCVQPRLRDCTLFSQPLLCVPPPPLFCRFGCGRGLHLLSAVILWSLVVSRESASLVWPRKYADCKLRKWNCKLALYSQCADALSHDRDPTQDGDSIL